MKINKWQLAGLVASIIGAGVGFMAGNTVVVVCFVVAMVGHVVALRD